MRAWIASVGRGGDERRPGVSDEVYVQSNEAEGNRVLAFRRGADEMLTELGSFSTGGAGSGTPHLPSQGSVVLTGDGRHLFVTNAGSGDLSVFATDLDALTLLQTIPTGGGAPRSVTEHSDLVYVLNTERPSLSGFRLRDGGLEPVADSMRALSPGSDPAQVGFTSDGAGIVVTNRGTDSITLYPVDESGQLGEPVKQPSSGPTPYGFVFANDGTLVVTEAFGAQEGKAAASSYVVESGSLTARSRSVGNGRSEICWAVVTNDGRYVFTTNFADGAVSRYALRSDGSLELEDATAGIAVDGQTGLRDEDLSGDGRFLYALNADARSIFGWAVGADGTLSALGAWRGLPGSAAGLAAS
jgi:6-phosphogluconolactonase (cycloisomerase 2 family)